MKRLTLLASALLVTVGSFAANGNTTPVKERNEDQSKIAIIQGREVMKLVYLNEVSDRVSISVYNEKGQKLVSTSVKSKDGFIQPFNFTQVEEGEYTFEITDDSGTIIENISLDRTETNISTVYKIKDSDKYRLNVLSEGDDITVKIMDEDLNVIHEDKFMDADSFSRIYDLSEHKGKGLYFTVKSDREEDVHYSELK